MLIVLLPTALLWIGLKLAVHYDRMWERIPEQFHLIAAVIFCLPLALGLWAGIIWAGIETWHGVASLWPSPAIADAKP